MRQKQGSKGGKPLTRLSLKIVPDDEKGLFHCGETIHGTVQVTVHEACRAEKLVVAIGCKGTGAAPQQRINFLSETYRETLFSGDWLPESYRYPFTLTAPEGCTYADTIMAINWFLCAGVGGGVKTVWRSGGVMTSSSGLDIEDVKDIVLVPTQVTSADRERMHAAELVRRETVRPATGCVLWPVLLTLGGSWAAWAGWEKELHYPGIFLAFVSLAGIGLAGWRALIGRKISSTELRLGSLMVWPGERVLCSVSIKAQVPIEIRKATLILTGWEEVKKYTGMYRTTGPMNKHIVHRHEQSLALPVTNLPAGGSAQIQGEFEVPVNAPCTMDFDNEVKLLWQVEMSVQVNGSPLWFDIQPITVLPRIARHPSDQVVFRS
jgi:hypothetical protein